MLDMLKSIKKVTEMNALLIKIQYTNTESRYKE